MTPKRDTLDKSHHTTVLLKTELRNYPQNAKAPFPGQVRIKQVGNGATERLNMSVKPL